MNTGHGPFAQLRTQCGCPATAFKRGLERSPLPLNKRRGCTRCAGTGIIKGYEAGRQIICLSRFAHAEVPGSYEAMAKKVRAEKKKARARPFDGSYGRGDFPAINFGNLTPSHA